MPYELIAVSAAACWALAGVVSVQPARELGTLAFNRIRLFTVLPTLFVAALLFGHGEAPSPESILLLVLSSIAGIVIGDAAVFLSLVRLGPRKTNLLYTTHSPMTVILAFFLLNERPGLLDFAGIVLVVAGIFLALSTAGRREQHHWEIPQGSVVAGLGFGLLSALGQALGTIIAKPVMQQGVDIWTASCIRVGVAALCLQLLYHSGVRALRVETGVDARMLLRIFLSGLLAITLGATFLLLALGTGDAGTVAVLTSLTPVIILPMLFVVTRQLPSLAQVCGAVLAVLGTSLIVTT